MTSRPAPPWNLAVSLSIGGAVAAALPNSITGLNRNLHALKDAQNADRREARDLKRSLRELTAGTDEHSAATKRLASLDARIKERSGQIQEQSQAVGLASQRMDKWRGVMKKGAVVLGVVTAAAVGLGVALNKVSDIVVNLDRDSAAVGATMEDLARDAAALGVVLGDSGLGRQAAQGMAEFQQQLRLAQRGIGSVSSELKLAGQAGLNLFNLDASDSTRFRRQLVDIIRSASPAQTDILTQLLPPAVFQAVRAESRATSDVLGLQRQATARAVPTQEELQALLEFSGGFHNLQGSAGSLLRQTLVPFAPVLTRVLGLAVRVTDAVGGWVERNQQLVSNVALVISVLTGVIGVTAGIVTGIAAVKLGAAALGIVLGTVGLPILAIIAIVAGLTVGIVLLIKHWDKAVAAFGIGSRFIGQHWDKLLAYVFPFIGIPVLIIRHWGAIGNFFQGLAGRVGRTFAGMAQFILRTVRSAAETFNAIPLVPNINLEGLDRLERNVARLRHGGGGGPGAGGAATITDNSQQTNTFNITEASRR